MDEANMDAGPESRPESRALPAPALDPRQVPLWQALNLLADALVAEAGRQSDPRGLLSQISRHARDAERLLGGGYRRGAGLLPHGWLAYGLLESVQHGLTMAEVQRLTPAIAGLQEAAVQARGLLRFCLIQTEHEQFGPCRGER